MGFRYGSVCSGIEAATEGWHHLGWEPAWFSEIEEFPRQYLTHHYPQVPLYGDFTQLRDTLPEDQRRIDLLVGGTPCQDFSIAGLRKGLDGDRGNLSLEFMRLADALRPQWVLWENVPGVLSQSGGRAFGSILGALAELGYGWSYRVLDAKNHGVPQRRRRVFLVGYLGDWRRAAAVLFDSASMRRDPPKGKKTEQEVAGTLGGGSGSRGWAPDTDRMTFLPVEVPEVAGTLNRAQARNGASSDPDRITYLPMVGREKVISYPQDVAPTLDASFAKLQGQDNQHIKAGGGLFVPQRVFSAEGGHEGSPTLTSSNLAKNNNQMPLVISETHPCLRAGNERNNSDASQEIQTLVLVPEVAATLRGGGSTEASHGKRSGDDEQTLIVASTLRAARNHHENLVECVTGQITHALTSEGADASEDGTGRGTPIVLSVAENQRAEVVLSDQTQALSAGGGKPGQGYPAILFNHQSGGSSMQLSPQTEVANTLVANQTQAALVENYRVRRLTPKECERLQGFPDERTLVPIGWTRGKTPRQKMASDSVRYRALGNSMAVVVMRWLATRIDLVHSLQFDHWSDR